MDQSTLTNIQRTLLEQIGVAKIADEFYLAGGTALALHLAHRRSEDFDFFSSIAFDAQEKDRTIAKAFPRTPILVEKQTVIATISGIQISFMYYPYPLLQETVILDSSLAVASIEDICTMKLSTIAARGAKRDFLDLYFICASQFPLSQAIDLYEKRFRGAAADRYHLLRSLTYFADAEEDPMPRLQRSIEWKTARNFFVSEARKLL